MRKIVITTDEDDYGMPRRVMDYFGITSDRSARTDERIIYLVENPDNVIDELERDIRRLTVVTIPDEATDWDVCPWANYEAIVYVLNGKLGYAFPEY